LVCCGAEGDHFLERIIMGDETWIHHYEPRVNARVWNGHILIRPPRKSSNASNCRKAYADMFFGLTRATAGTLSREGFSSEQC
jgi:hypothetical protein